jgi:hypothetical protein
MKNLMLGIALVGLVGCAGKQLNCNETCALQDLYCESAAITGPHAYRLMRDMIQDQDAKAFACRQPQSAEASRVAEFRRIASEKLKAR